ncbi:MAG TPA: hypothetical protein VE078_13375, partial [Thermoanaerobaculia bacterium]|nr:hypothetical protein [Thermoanaerobaculia bacterium]
MEPHLVLIGEGPAHRGGDLRRIRAPLLALDFLDEHELFFAVYVYRERRARARPQRRMGALRRQLQVLRVVVRPADD